jgi:putative flippase GtrA
MSIGPGGQPPTGVLRLVPEAIRTRVQSKHVKFVIIGIYNTLFGYAVFAALHLALPHVNYMLVLIVSRELSVVSAFIAYRLFVFKVKGALVPDFVRFWMVYSGALIINLIALPFLVLIVGLNVLVAQAITVIFMVISTWIGHNHFSFRRLDSERDPETALEAV